ncbi:MAG: GTPase Era [Lachnospiraceae bacterium]|nr:GTPase Era [Lachnospiraceae bacterium]
MSENKNVRAGFAAIAGRPNVGKSTLMNRIIGQKIAITSDKPQTTRNRIRTVYTCDEGQIVFLDTPGIHKAKNRLGEYMISSVNAALKDVDVILWLVEASVYVGPTDKSIAEKLNGLNVPVILVINKIDKIGKDELLKVIDAYRVLCDFAQVVPVSALTGDNTDTLIEQIFKYLPYGEPFYDEDTVTDQPQRQIAAEMIREKALKCLDEEVPHGIAVTIERMEFKPDIVHIDATIICEKESHKGIIIGRQGQMLKKIGSAARYEIERMLEMQVNLKLWVKVRRDWRDSDVLLKNFGYDTRDIKD